VRAALGALLLLAACSRVPEQALRDEQARSRQYRDAYESLSAEVASLKSRLADLERRCPAKQP
jgi:hypothetical protein